MNENKAPEGGAFELLSWTTPRQFHFIVDRYNDFVEVARDDGERAKLWTTLEDDWSSVWDFTPEIMQKLKKYYYTMCGVNIERGLLQGSKLLPSRSQSCDSVLTNNGQSRDANINEQARSLRVLSSAQSTSPRTNEYRPPCLNSAFKLGERQVLYSSNTSNEWLVDVPGLVRSEIRTVLMAGSVLVHAEKVATKGKEKENAFDDPLLPSQPLNEKVELPFGVQHADIRAKVDGGRLTFQISNELTHRTSIVVEDLDEVEG
ncbi:hypothetical protein CCMSSC00406_0009817 [Pleurotus cornucopiae]|uniref:Uncharacterized protein n=1 Tax=Pleurotus cornucopiae TaxID=5321 RepID=A0ACB7IIE3_PLECO|nr:hypothetical protein CCMSSC00406_0009817 [Pleurotus cornucopiae]